MPEVRSLVQSTPPAARRASDELLDVWVFRPLAALVVRAALPLRVTPNQVTVAAVFFGCMAGWLFALRQPWSLLAGVASAVASMVLDCADGQLARARGGGTTAGRILDGLADYVVAFGIHLGALFFLYGGDYFIGGHRLSHPELFLLMLAAGASMAVQCALYDFYKHRYLAFVGVDYRRSLETPENLSTEIERTDSTTERALLRILRFYLRGQETLMPRRSVEQATIAPSSEAASRFARANEPLLRAWSMLGPSGHFVLICLAAVVSIWRTDGFLLYAGFAVGLQNVYTLVLLAVQGRANRFLAHSAVGVPWSER